MKIIIFFVIILIMYEKIFQNIFHSKIKIYLLRYLFCNKQPFKLKEIEDFLNLKGQEKKLLKKEVKKLLDIGLLTKRNKNFYFKNNFFLFEELKNLSLKYSPELYLEIKRIIKSIGNVNFLALGGVFSSNKIDLFEEERTDILLVLSRLNPSLEKKASLKIKKIEHFVGCEINYILLSKKEFDYRLAMFDKFLENWLNQEPIILIKREKRNISK